ncbi:uncharacterized protein LOC122326208 [Puntigrus tetrazona]|uniref:uncharacterized protein LOC122326208 n=1 Tax=Puntigrus tetrazona TaxID=1606681 RepID=UPI001C89AACC|nr:uncharacterized protein LOC122326208 [Puntigrus tetrazona]XP_043076865.1 uncharacterized protein LOC122326208 [Puntigrus tetrazona]
MEQIRVSLLSEVKKKNNNEQTLRRLMDLSFALRRQEVVKESLLIVDFMSRWPALFHENEVCAEFAWITTVALISKFFSKLDEHTPSLLRIFAKRGGAQGRRIKKLLVPLTKCACINVKRERVLKALFVYRNEDSDNLIKEYMDVDFSIAETALKEVVMGVFVIRCEGGEGCEDEPVDVGVVLEGVTALEGLGNSMGQQQSRRDKVRVLSGKRQEARRDRRKRRDEEVSEVCLFLLLYVSSCSVENNDHQQPPANVPEVLSAAEDQPRDLDGPVSPSADERAPHLLKQLDCDEITRV